MTALQGFLTDERGLETVEYAIIAGLIVGALVLIMVAIGDWVSERYETMQTELGA
ncbi:MAG: Flp family type IVb pilin [Planctomycetota bacterium]|jgi:Flp pilus assembly pilin Flp